MTIQHTLSNTAFSIRRLHTVGSHQTSMKTVLDVTGFRTRDLSGTYDPTTLGWEACQIVNGNTIPFYPVSSGKNQLWKEPDWDAIYTALVAYINPNKHVYFDLESWLNDARTRKTDGSDTRTHVDITLDVYQQQLFACRLLSTFWQAFPTFNKTIGIFGIPNGNWKPANGNNDRIAWDATNKELMNGGLLSDFLLNQVNTLMPAFYPGYYSYATSDSNNLLWNYQYNTDLMDQLKKHVLDRRSTIGGTKYKVYGFFQPRIKKSEVINGVTYDYRPYMNYDDTYALVYWILNNCDGMMLFDWDGYGNGHWNPAANGGAGGWTGISAWDTNAPWVQAIRDCLAYFNNSIISENV